MCISREVFKNLTKLFPQTETNLKRQARERRLHFMKKSYNPSSSSSEDDENESFEKKRVLNSN